MVSGFPLFENQPFLRDLEQFVLTDIGKISFAMAGQAHGTFLSKSISLCVHHPLKGCAGRPCTIEKPDGSTERGLFPEFVAPHQPFLDIRAMTHEVKSGVRAEARFAGEVFETEDQRNWTDANYKTYAPPLRLPFPVGVRAGTEHSLARRVFDCGDCGCAPGNRAVRRGRQDAGESHAASPGLLICILAGIFSPMLNFSLAFGDGSGPRSYWAFGTLMGLLCYGSFIVYGAGANGLGPLGPIVGWPLFMSMSLVTSNCLGWLSGEWKGAPSRAIAFGAEPSPFSDAAKLAIRWGTAQYISPDWKRIYDREVLGGAVRAIL